MTLKKLIVLILAAALAASCGMKQKPGALEGDTDQAAGSAFTLPDVGAADQNTVASADKPKERKVDLEAVTRGQDGDDQYIILNFDRADIETVVNTFGELLNINYILTPGVAGSITVQSYNRVPMASLLDVFQTILEINGLTAVKNGDFYIIVPIESAKDRPMEVFLGRKVDFNVDSTFITQIIQLQNVKAGDISTVLRNFMPRGATLVVYEPANILIITALPKTVQKFVRLVEALDTTESESETVKTFVYYVENGEAKKLENILKTVFLNQKDDTAAAAAAQAAQTRVTTMPITPPRPGQPLRITTAVQPAASTAEGFAASLGDMSISAYEDINALIIKSTPRNYLALLEVLRKIDVPPRQVLIEVTLAEVTLNDELHYGLNWFVKNNGDKYIYGFNMGGFSDIINGTNSVTQAAVTGGSPISTGFGIAASGHTDTKKMAGFMSALSTLGNVNILASPNILAIDNKEAELKIGSEIPTATSTTTSAETTSTSSQIQYKTVGTLLSLTPHITEKGNVSLKVVVESSDIGAQTTIASNTYPSFTTRKASTNAVVKDDHTLFLGGIISDRKEKGGSGIPVLRNLPLIGWIFGTADWVKKRTELLIMITPHVILNEADADHYTKEFKERVRIIKKSINRSYKEDKEVDKQMRKDSEERAKADLARKESEKSGADAEVKPSEPAPSQSPEAVIPR